MHWTLNKMAGNNRDALLWALVRWRKDAKK